MTADYVYGYDYDYKYDDEESTLMILGLFQLMRCWVFRSKKCGAVSLVDILRGCLESVIGPSYRDLLHVLLNTALGQ